MTYRGWEHVTEADLELLTKRNNTMTKRAEKDQRYVSIKKAVRNLPCRLTGDELLIRADELSVVVQETNGEEVRQADVKAQMKARLTELDARKTRLAITIGRKEEYRDVEVELVADIQAQTTTIYRQDTGEAIETRPMSEQEKQAALPLETSAA